MAATPIAGVPSPGAPGMGDPYYPLLGNGGYHALRRTADARRDRALRRLGYRVLRIEAELVLKVHNFAELAGNSAGVLASVGTKVIDAAAVAAAVFAGASAGPAACSAR